MRTIISLLCLLMLYSSGWSQDLNLPEPDELKVLKGTFEEKKAETMFLEHVKRVIFAQIDERDKTIENLKTADDWKNHIKYVEKTFKEIIGEFPERTPLNAKVIDVLDRKEYKIEKIIFESFPQFYVTCNMYIPKRVSFPVPAVLNVLGHSLNGKARDAYQAIFINLAKKGYIAFAMDPISQGERFQYIDRKTGEDMVPGSSTAEHNMGGHQCQLLGINLAKYRTWDGMRAVDYLYTRPEVDKNRIACTGVSGGGTMTSYLAGLDKRINVAVPVDYITTWRSRIEAHLTTDSEQLFAGTLVKGADNRSDFTFLIAPRPLLVGIGIRDKLNPYWGVQAFKPVVERLYKTLGYEDRVDFAIVDVEHAYSKQHRQALYLWLHKWFNYGSSNTEEPPFTIEKDETLWCTEKGQVLASLGGKNVADLNREYFLEIAPDFRKPRSVNDFGVQKEKIIEKAKKLTGYENLSMPLRPRKVGSFQWGNFNGEKIIYYSDSDIYVPALLIFPEKINPPHPAVVLVDETTKEPDRNSWSIIKTILDKRSAVFIIDPRGMGETGIKNISQPQIYSIMTNRPAFGMQLSDVAAALLYLEKRDDIVKEKIGCLGKGHGGLLALYAAALEPKFAASSTIEQLYTYKSIVMNDIYKYGLEIIVPGILKYYDLPNLAGVVAPRPLLIINPVNHNKEVISDNVLSKDYIWTHQAYSASGFAENINIIYNADSSEVSKKIAEWLDLWTK